MDEWGIHHRVLNAVVETKPGTGCYGIMDVYTDRLELRGTGDMVSAIMHARLQKRNGRQSVPATAQRCRIGWFSDCKTDKLSVIKSQMKMCNLSLR